MKLLRQFKIIVNFEDREDGGLRAWSPDVPGLVLSNADPDVVFAAVAPALTAILREQLKCDVVQISELEPVPQSGPVLGQHPQPQPAFRRARRAAVPIGGPLMPVPAPHAPKLEFAAACG